VNDVVVTVRMPVSLIEAVEEQVSEGHFLDFSEAVRSIIRSRFLESYPLRKISEQEERRTREIPGQSKGKNGKNGQEVSR